MVESVCGCVEREKEREGGGGREGGREGGGEGERSQEKYNRSVGTGSAGYTRRVPIKV